MKEDRDMDMSCAGGFEKRRKSRKRPMTSNATIPSLRLPVIPSAAKTAASRRLSLQFSPTSPVFSMGTSIPWEGQENIRSSTKLMFNDEKFEVRRMQ